MGGTVEPSNRKAAARVTPSAPTLPEGSRFELRDPTTELIYHAKTFDEMVGKAERLGALRFTAVDEQDRRAFVHKVDGAWQRPPWQEPKTPARQREPAATTAKVVPLTPATSLEAATTVRADAAAERAALVARLEAALNERYVIKRAMLTVGDRPIGQTEYRFRGDTSRVAFTESAFRLSTDTNSPSVARSMVDVAEARHWQSLRVSGHEDFRRMVWLEASLRGVKTIGYEPVAGDQELLRKEREARQINRIEPTAETPSAVGTGKPSARGGGSRKTVLAAIEAVLVAQRVPEKKREAIMTAAADNLARRLAAGEVHRVKVYDKSAPQQRPVVRPTPEQQRGRERATPIR
jgi:hypothetical protein